MATSRLDLHPVIWTHDEKNTWEKKPVPGHERVPAESVVLQRQLVKSDRGLGQQPLLRLHLGRDDALGWEGRRGKMKSQSGEQR